MQPAYYSNMEDYKDEIVKNSQVSAGKYYTCESSKAYLILCYDGCAYISYSGKTIELPAGQYCLVAGVARFAVDPRCDGKVYLLPFDPSRHIKSGEAPKGFMLHCLSSEGLLVLDAMHQELERQKAGYCAVVSGLAMRLLEEAVSEYASRQCKPKELSIEEIEKYILDHSSEATLKSAAAHFYYHPNTLAKFIRSKCGKSFSVLSREIRLNRAARLLAETDLPVYKIAKLCGYHNMTHFYDLFEKTYGKTPSNYRA